MRERKRKHDDAHYPLGGKGKRATRKSPKLFPNGKCNHPMITIGVIDRCSYCGEVVPKEGEQ